jgi:hypothetical protein
VICKKPYEAPSLRFDRSAVCANKACKNERRKLRQQSYKRAANPNYKPRERVMTTEERRASLLESKKRYRESEAGKAAIAAYRQETVEERAAWAREYHKTYVKPQTEEQLRARRRRKRMRALLRFGGFKQFAKRSISLRYIQRYAQMTPEMRELFLAKQAARDRVKYRKPGHLEKIKRRRQEGSAAYNLLCDLGQMIPTNNQNEARRLHVKARRLMIKAGFGEHLKESVL